MKQVRVLKIVVASPSDVQAERDAIPAIIEELKKGIADERGVSLRVYRWETDAYPAFHPQGPQGQIDSCLRIEDCDLLIAIFWKRFGTPVLDAQSGTEHEIRLALESCEKMGRPQLMIYFNQAPHEPQSQAEKDQWQQVLDFKQTLSEKVLWREYNGKHQFQDFVRQHLTKFVRGDSSGRPLEELLQAYRDHLARRVSTVRIFGEAETRPLEKVFVELALTEEYERPMSNAQWLGLMDAELRRRRDIFARDDEDREIGLPDKERKKAKRTLKPDELLGSRTQAVIVGAPGCGKTTLLHYLALKTLQSDKRFPVFFELKSLSEKAFEAAEGNLVELLFAKAIAAPLGFSAAEAERCKAFFLAHLKVGEVTIFLDGLDEVAGARFFSALCRSVNEFMASAYRHNDLIISTRPYALQHRFEGLQEIEIASLSPRLFQSHAGRNGSTAYDIGLGAQAR
ncbi:MAG: NACHT domain-containing protein [bacterium]